MACACIGPQNGEPLCPCRMAVTRVHDVRYPFTPNWILPPTASMAVKLSIALHRHIPDWPGATDEQLEAVAAEIMDTPL